MSDILDAIDGAIRDLSISSDAMRWTPEPAAPTLIAAPNAPAYGTATIERRNGKLFVTHADPWIHVSRDLWNELKPPHKQEGGRLQLDTDGVYVYAFWRDEQSPHGFAHDTLIFRRVYNHPEPS